MKSNTMKKLYHQCSIVAMDVLLKLYSSFLNSRPMISDPFVLVNLTAGNTNIHHCKVIHQVIITDLQITFRIRDIFLEKLHCLFDVFPKISEWEMLTGIFHGYFSIFLLLQSNTHTHTQRKLRKSNWFSSEL